MTQTTGGIGPLGRLRSGCRTLRMLTLFLAMSGWARAGVLGRPVAVGSEQELYEVK